MWQNTLRGVLSADIITCGEYTRENPAHVNCCCRNHSLSEKLLTILWHTFVIIFLYLLFLEHLLILLSFFLTILLRIYCIINVVIIKVFTKYVASTYILIKLNQILFVQIFPSFSASNLFCMYYSERASLCLYNELYDFHLNVIPTGLTCLCPCPARQRLYSHLQQTKRTSLWKNGLKCHRTSRCSECICDMSAFFMEP